MASVNKRPLWGNGINLNGLYSIVPLRCKWNVSLKEYYAADGNFSVNGEGERRSGGHTEFASYKKEEVIAWSAGVRATMDMLKQWCGWQKWQR